MFEHQRQIYLMSSASGLSADVEWNVRLVRMSQEIFRAAQRRARWRRFLGWFGINRKRLLDLNAVCVKDCEDLYELPGVQAVALDKIRGSEGRCADFDGDFLPLHDHLEARWMAIMAIMLQCQPLPAVELVQVGEVYFVRDGHHRVSAARFLGQRHIDARVTVWNVNGPAGSQVDRVTAQAAGQMFSFGL